MPQPLRVEVAGETNVGRKRNHNEDNLAIFSEFGLYVVADGMGGHASGEVASKMAVDTLREFFAATSDDPERTWPYKMDRSKGYEENRLITGIKLANLRIYEAAQRDARQRGMGTTIVSIFAVDDGVYVAHVGDSRVYRVRERAIEQLTEDHSLLNDYIKMKRLTAEEIAELSAQERDRPRARHEGHGQGRHALRGASRRRRDPPVLRRTLGSGHGCSNPEHRRDLHRPADRRPSTHRSRERERRPGQHHLRARSLDLVVRGGAHPAGRVAHLTGSVGMSTK